MRFNAVANRFAYLAGTGRSLTIFGRGDQIWPFIHVKDTGSLVRLHFLNFTDFSGMIIKGKSQNTLILDIVETIQRSWPGVNVSYTE
jgi:nucleoside-diphosphate-sugar epimerase